MLEYLFMVCMYMDGSKPVYRKVELIKEVVICSGNNCANGFQVVYARTVPAVKVYESQCLYVTKENKNDLKYQE